MISRMNKIKWIFRQRNFSLFFDKSFSKGFWRQVIWLLLLMLVVYLLLVLLSYNDFFYTEGSAESEGRWYDVMFLLMNPGGPTEYLHSPYALLIGVLGMAVFSGMLISVISNLLERRVDRYIAGETDYKVSNHVIILGFNKSIPSLLKRIYLNRNTSFIVLMCDRNSNDVRDWIHANVEKDIENRLIVMNGVRDAMDDLSRLCLDNDPKEIYVLGEENEEGHDEISLECLKKISSIRRANSPKVPCYVQIDSSSVFSILQQADFGEKEKIEDLDLHPFNFNEIWAQKVLSLTDFEGDGYIPLDGKGIGLESRNHVHLIIVGMTDLGKSLALNAAHVLHFPNFKEGDFETYTRITFIDKRADELGERFRNRHSVLFELARWKAGNNWVDPLSDEDSSSPYKYLGPKNFMDIEWEFIKGDIASPEIRQYLENSCSENNSLTTIALCEDNSDRNLAICLGLPLNILQGPALNMLLVRQREGDMAIKLLESIPLRGDKVKAFGMMSECYEENLLTDRYGKLINALYNGDINISSDDKETIDKIEKAWSDASITDRWSSNYSANMLFVKLRSLGFNNDNISEKAIVSQLSKPEVQEWIQKTEHNRWITERILQGFIPLTLEEQNKFESFRNDPNKTKKERKNLTKETKKHLDLCSNETLSIIDPTVAKYDNIVNEKLWQLYQKINHEK